jgi:capsular polysaccharide biosynthesis protein
MSWLRPRSLRAPVLIVPGLIVGVVGAFAYSLTESKLYRAQTALIAQSGSQPVTGGVLQTISDLLSTDIVAQNVIRNRQLTESSSQFFKRMHVKIAGSVITVAIDDKSQDEAVRLAQELSLVFAQLVRDRFGSAANAAGVTIFDPAHAVGQVSPNVRRDIGWGALFGALLGLLVANVFVLRGRRGIWMPAPYPYLEVPVLTTGEPPALPGPDQPQLLGVDDEEIAATLVARSAEDPFQTVLVAGDADGSITAGIAQALAGRGEVTMWLRAADADEAELDRLTARCAYVLVAAPSLDPVLALTVDAVAVVTDGSPFQAPHGVRVIGTVAR